MKAMILAAGQGTRLHPLTLSTPKPLLKVGEKSLIEYHIIALKAAGIEEIVINYSYLGELFEALLGTGEDYGVRLHYSSEPKGGLETGGGILNALAYLSDAPFLVVNADVYTNFNFSSLPKELDGLAHLVLVTNPEHNASGDFSLENRRVKNANSNNLTYSGIGVYSPKLFFGSSAGRFPLTPMLQQAADEDSITGEYFSGIWQDVGTIDRLDAVRKLHRG